MPDFFPDRHFENRQQSRLEELFAKWRDLRDQGLTLTPSEHYELETLTELEVEASGNRASELARQWIPSE
jgi:hypothetical protein